MPKTSPKTLVECFNTNRQYALREKLKKATSLQQVADIIDDELASYADTQGDYIKSLQSPAEAKTALALLAFLRESNGVLGDTVTFTQEPPKERASHKPPSEPFDQDTIVITLSASAGTLVGLIAGPFGGIIGAAMGSGFGKILAELMKQDSKRENQEKSQKYIQLQLNLEKLISELNNLFKKIDEQVLNKNQVPEPKHEEPEPQLSDFREIIEFIQKITGERYLGLDERLDFALHEELPSLLRIYRMEIHELSSEDIGDERKLSPEIHQMYDIMTSERFEQPFIEVPAIIKEGKVFLRGRIYLPNPESKRISSH